MTERRRDPSESDEEMTDDGMTKLRVLDFGTVGAWRSQSLWHGLAAAMSPGSTPVLSFCRPAEPYVGLGYHRSLDEIDLDACRRLGLPVIRRQIGGGPVYLDRDQLFFQITLPADLAPPRVDHLYELALEPAAAAFRALGLDARRNRNDLAVADRKLSGTGAGRIGDGVTVVGNVLFRFPHRRMAEVLAFDNERLRAECLRLMRRHVSSLQAEGLTEVDAAAARGALVEAYGRAFGTPTFSTATAAEEAAIEGWEERLRSPAWLAGATGPQQLHRQIKISADAWMLAADGGVLAVEASIIRRRFERVRVTSPSRNGAAERMAAALAGRRMEPATIRRCLEPFADAGRALEEMLEPGLRRIR